MRGAFITIEGIDGSGKDTLAVKIREYLLSHNIDVLLTKEPGDVFNGKVREILMNDNPLPLSEMFLFLADRHEHVERVIKPALSAGQWVISVRFADSSMAYQGARGIDRELIEKLNMEAIGNVYPDLTILLDLSTHEAMKRIKGRGNTIEHFERNEFLKKVRKLYLEDASKHTDRVVIVDASFEPDEIFNVVKPYIDRLLKQYIVEEIDLSRAHVSDAILKAIDSGMHAILIHGEWGCGHEYLVRDLLSKIIVSLRDDEEEIYGASPDLMIIRGDKTSPIKIEVIREIGEFLDYRPLEGKYKVVVIEDASYMTLQAANALLKILEEPPHWGIFIMYTSYVERLLSTIRSRCISFRIERFPISGLTRYIVDRYGIDEKQAYVVAKMTEGCPSRIEHILKVLAAQSVVRLIEGDFYEYLKLEPMVVEDNVLWDKLFYEVEASVIGKIISGNGRWTADDVLMLVEFEGMLNTNVQKKIISDLVYWKLKEGINDVHIS